MGNGVSCAVLRWGGGLTRCDLRAGCRLVGALYLNPFFLQGFSLADRSWRGAAGLGDLTRSARLVVSRLPSLCRRLAAHAVNSPFEGDNSTEDGNALRAMLRPRRRPNVCCAVDCACGGSGPMITPVNNLLLPRGVIRSPHPAITHATTRRVAPGAEKLYYGKPPVNMQFLHMFNFLKTMTLANHCLDRNHLRGLSGVGLIELESEYKNTTSAEMPRRPWDASCSSHWGRF